MRSLNSRIAGTQSEGWKRGVMKLGYLLLARQWILGSSLEEGVVRLVDDASPNPGKAGVAANGKAKVDVPERSRRNVDKEERAHWLLTCHGIVTLGITSSPYSHSIKQWILKMMLHCNPSSMTALFQPQDIASLQRHFDWF